MTGDDIARLDQFSLGARAESVNLFCRVTPLQKQRLILALKARGHTVGYMGDGINDAPSLHSADVGLSVDSAVDVAKEAADMIMLERDLRVLHACVLEGRRTFANTLKYILMGTSSNFGNMFSMAGAAMLLPFLPMLPTQILLNNILYDISEIPIPLDHVDDTDVAVPKTLNVKSVVWFMVTIGPISSLFDFLTFYLMLAGLNAGPAEFHTGWFVESLATQVLVIFIIRTRGNPLRSRPHAALIVTSLAVVGLAILLPYTWVGSYVGLVPLPGIYFAALAGIVAVYLAMVQAIKYLLRRTLFPTHPPTRHAHLQPQG
jgi:Mg2+-importing ATPase